MMPFLYSVKQPYIVFHAGYLNFNGAKGLFFSILDEEANNH